MGCNSSRLDRLPVVALCRDRCKFLDEALHQSYFLADAHLAHMHSLQTLGPALHSFFHHHEDSGGHADHSIKPKSPPPAASPVHTSSSSSDSDLHAHSHSGSSESENNTDKNFQFLSPTRYDYRNHDPAADDVVFMNYMQHLYPPFSPPLSNSKPPSPPPPSSSAWDFLNLFETFEKYEVRYSPSRDTKEEKRKESQRSSKNEATKAVDGSDNGGVKADRADNGGARKEGADSTEKEQQEAKNSGEPAKVKSAKGLSEIMKEIQILMERASDSGSPVLGMLDVGKLRYHKRIAVNPVSCEMMMHVFTPLVSSKSPTVVKSTEYSLTCQRTGSGHQRVDKDGGNLSSTLKKLSMWENKLYDEVKVEEKLHVLYKKKCRQLSRAMNKKYADAQKVDSLKAFIQIISTKMKISIQVVDKISSTVCKLGEEELWPLINEFILRLRGMWKEMQECYRCQNQGMEEARSAEAGSLSRKHMSKEHVEAAIRLKCELQKWNIRFSEWIHAQKCHVKALNGWLRRCLPEQETGEGSASVLVICNKWWEAVEKMSGKKVMEGVNELICGVNEVLDKYVSELQQRLAVEKELERRIRVAERQEQKMQRVVRAREEEEKMECVDRQETEAMLSGGGVHHSQPFQSGSGSLHCRLSHIFAALESFTAISASAYELLCQHIDQGSHSIH